MNHPQGRLVSIYGLTDPQTGEVRYVGWSINAAKRLSKHVQVAKSGRETNHRTNWIRSLIEAGITPGLIILERGVRNFAMRERFWIKRFRFLRHRLTNGTDGGEGMLGHTPSAHTRELLSLARYRNPPPPPPSPTEETRNKVRDSNRRRVWTPEMREKLSAAHRGKKHHWASRKGRKPCSVCGLPQNAKGLCGKHYQQLRRDSLRQPMVSA